MKNENQEFIDRLTFYQESGVFFPITCSNDYTHMLLRPREKNGKVVMVCPTCGSTISNIPKIPTIEEMKRKCVLHAKKGFERIFNKNVKYPHRKKEEK